MDEKLNKNFYKALHLVFRSKIKHFNDIIYCNLSILAFVDDLNEYSFSFGMYLPPMVRKAKIYCLASNMVNKK